MTLNLVVDIEVSNRQIRIISGYGPQENWTESDRLPFFLALEAEVVKAEMEDKSVLIQMDANSKLGPEVIKSDPHPQSPNGRLLHGLLERHGLVVVNGIVSFFILYYENSIHNSIRAFQWNCQPNVKR